MHEHVCQQLRGVEIGRLDIVERAKLHDVYAEPVGKRHGGEPDYEVDDYEIFCNRRNVTEYRAS